MKIIDKIYPVLNIIIGIGAFLMILVDVFYPDFIEISLEPPFQIVSTLLSFILIALGYERLKQKENIENSLLKFAKSIGYITDNIRGLQSSVKNISNFEIIEGRDRITDESIKEIRKVKHHIRATTLDMVC